MATNDVFMTVTVNLKYVEHRIAVNKNYDYQKTRFEGKFFLIFPK